MRVGVLTTPIGRPRHRHLAENGGQRAGVVGLDVAAGHAVGVCHLVQALLAPGP
jgi:hypothetical protein